MAVSLFENSGRWIVFVGAALAMSWFLRLLAARAARRGTRQLGEARVALGLSREIPSKFVISARPRGNRRDAEDVLERDGRDG